MNLKYGSIILKLGKVKQKAQLNLEDTPQKRPGRSRRFPLDQTRKGYLRFAVSSVVPHELTDFTV